MQHKYFKQLDKFGFLSGKLKFGPGKVKIIFSEIFSLMNYLRLKIYLCIIWCPMHTKNSL